MKCRFIDTGFNDAFTNMAIDEAILQHCRVPTLRVYGWRPAAISVGYNQNVQREINIDYCKKNNIDLITLSGFKKNNPLSQSGNINFYVESEEYNFIEMTHHIILLSIVDIFAKKIY